MEWDWSQFFGGLAEPIRTVLALPSLINLKDLLSFQYFLILFIELILWVGILLTLKWIDGGVHDSDWLKE